MKHKGKRIYRKQKQRRFKNIKRPNQSAASAVKPQADQKVTPSKSQKPAFHFLWFEKLFKKRVTSQPQIEKAPKDKEANRFNKAVSHWLKNHDSDIQLILFPLILLVILIIL